jgi:hypothetical protein
MNSGSDRRRDHAVVGGRGLAAAGCRPALTRSMRVVHACPTPSGRASPMSRDIGDTGDWRVSLDPAGGPGLVVLRQGPMAGSIRWPASAVSWSLETAAIGRGLVAGCVTPADQARRDQCHASPRRNRSSPHAVPGR